jgi:hypothetical protein
MSPTTEIEKLSRYTTIPFLFDMLVRKKLTLLNPEFWEDYNDRKTVEVYKEKVKAKSIYALCMTYKNETVHHWNAFANGTSGCCIELNFKELKPFLDKIPEIKHAKAEYIKINDLNKYKKNVDLLPFIKRIPFHTENEYRIITTSSEKQNTTFDIPIELNVIQKITLSNKLARSVCDSLTLVILKIEPSLKNKVYRSTLFENSTWINAATEL